MLNAHLGLSRNERLAQIEALLGPDWLAHPHCRTPVILCGDFNVLPSSEVYRKVCRVLADTQRCASHQLPKATFPSRWPMVRLDYIFASRGLECLNARVVPSPLTRIASDHLPLVADVVHPAGRGEPALKSAT